MALKFDRADRNYMRAFAVGIGVLALITLIDIGIATWVWSSQGTPDRKSAIAFAGSTPTLVGILPAARAATPIAKAGHAAESGGTTNTEVAGAALGAPSQPPQGHSVAAASYQYDAHDGGTLFGSTCAACHQASGEGIPGVFPPLRGNAAVDDSNPATQLLTMLDGRHGVQIGGQDYSGVMPAFGGQFSDVQMADIANYERSSWGNHAKQVTPGDVAALRAKAK